MIPAGASPASATPGISEGVSPGESVTVVIPTYNNAALLDRTLAAVASQAAEPSLAWSAVVVDNNCTDATAEVVAKHAARGAIPRLTRVREPRQGLSQARQRGVREADGEWVVFVDDDVVGLSPRFVQEVADFGRDHPRAGTISAKIHLVWELEPSPLVLDCREGLAHVDFGDDAKMFPILGRTHIVGAALAVRRRAVMETGWMDGAILSDRKGSSLSSGGDMELGLRIRAAGYELWYNPRMEAGHFVPVRRMSRGYLCRLYHGFARSDAQLAAIAAAGSPGLPWRMQKLLSQVGYLGRRSAALFVHDLLRRRSLGGKRLVQVYEAVGGVQSAWELLWHGLPRDRRSSGPLAHRI